MKTIRVPKGLKKNIWKIEQANRRICTVFSMLYTVQYVRTTKEPGYLLKNVGRLETWALPIFGIESRQTVIEAGDHLQPARSVLGKVGPNEKTPHRLENPWT